MQSPKATDPFLDDEMPAPPMPPKDARIHRTTPKSQPVQYRKTASVSKPATVEPVRLAETDESTAEPREISHAIQTSRTKPTIKQVQHAGSAGRTIPKNSLRDE